jgi:uncharacterized protein HemX
MKAAGRKEVVTTIDDLKEVAQGFSGAPGSPSAPGSASAPGSSSGNKQLIIGMIVVVLLLSIGIAVWFFMFKDKKTERLDVEQKLDESFKQQIRNQLMNL